MVFYLLIPNDYHTSWSEFIEVRREELDKIEEKIGHDYTPSNPNHVLRFLNLDLNKVKVIWLGQDPYFVEGIATGRSFEDGALKSWVGNAPQPALRNIIRSIYGSIKNIDAYKEILKYNEIKKEISNGNFLIEETPEKWFASLEEQGVLFLNVYLTTKIGKAGEHEGIWKAFAMDLLKYINSKNAEIEWFLWGNDAKEIGSELVLKNKHEGRHPTYTSEGYEDDILYFNGFEKTKHMINWLGK